MTPNEPVNGWTLPAAMVYLTALIEGHEKNTEIQLKSIKELMVERDKSAPTKDEIQKQFKAIEADIRSLRETRTATHGEQTGLQVNRTDQREDRRVLLAGGAFIISLIALLMQIFL